VKFKKEVLLGIFVIVIMISAGVLLHNVFKRNEQSKFAARIADLEGRGGPPSSIDDLRRAIALYEERIEQHVRDAAQTGVYWRILAVRLQDKGLHNDAIDALERAVYYAPDDPALFYRIGLSASSLAKGGAFDFSGVANNGENKYYTMAEGAFLKAISLDSRYVKPLYALGVLYVFELGRPEEAIPLMEKYLELTVNDVDGMAILAHAYALTGQYNFALTLYDKILSITKDKDKRAAAEESRKRVMDAYYG
jgi:tetratricopeptide (TPR) repeat protein